MAARGTWIGEQWVYPQDLETGGRVDDRLSRRAPRTVIRGNQFEAACDHVVTPPAPSMMLNPFNTGVGMVLTRSKVEYPSQQ